MPQVVHHALKPVPELIEDAEIELPSILRLLLQKMHEHLQFIVRQLDEVEEQIRQWHKMNPASQRLTEIPGVGPITATAIVASINDATAFENGRQLAAWIGLVPRQHSSGGKARLLVGISKRGNRYLRMLLVLGAQVVIRVAHLHAGHETTWLKQLRDRRHKNIAVVALANKNARAIWAMLAKGQRYDARLQHGIPEWTSTSSS